MFGTWKSLELSCRYHCCCRFFGGWIQKSIGALHQCCQLCSTCGFILVFRSTLLCILESSGKLSNVSYDPSLSMNQSSSQVSSLVSAWPFLPFLVIGAILTGQARNGVSNSKATKQLVTVSRTFMILASLLWDPWRIYTNLIPRSYKLQIEVLKSTGVFKENLNNSTRTHVTHLKAEGSKYTH